jgi:dipeptidyl aminopeptidase/acylaminoacyl peptidase
MGCWQTGGVTGELTAEAVAGRAVPRTPRLSPDGRWVVFATATIGRAGEYPAGELWLVPADGGTPPRELAPGPDEDREPRWAPDSAAVFFLSDRGERGTAQLYRIRVAGGVAEALTTWAGGIRDHVPLADPDLVVLVAPDEEPAPGGVHVRGAHARPDRLRLLDLRTGRVRTLGGLGDRHVVEVAPRPDGGALAVLTWSAPEMEPGVHEPGLHLVDPGAGATTTLATPALEAAGLTWWRDGTAWHLAYVGLTPGGLIGGNAVFDVALPAGEPANLTAGMSVCPLELTQVDAGPPLALFAEGLDTTIRRLDPATLRFAEVSRSRGALRSLTASHAGTCAVVASTAHEPEDVHAGPPAGPLTRLSDTAPGLRAVAWGAQERLAYRAPDGLELDGLLVLPPGKTRADGPFPLVTLAHGGPYDRYADRFHLGWYPCAQWLAPAGFAVFLPNPRGGQGHGHAFAACVAGAVGGAEWTDLLAGIDLLVAEGVADPDRLGIGGWSHGGFVAAWAAGQTDRFAAALVGAGISDWGMLAATGEHSRFEAALGGSSGWEGPGPHPHDQRSPISYAAAIRTPILILHGEQDTNVPLSQAEYLHRALRHFGVEHEFVVYPRENHSPRERGHQVDVLERSREWFTRWLKPVRPA